MKLFANRFTEISKCAACVFAVTISFTMPMFAQNTNPSPLVPLAISASSTQDEWNAARLRGDEPAGFSNQKTSKPYVWDAQWLTLYERDKNGLCKRQGREYAQTAFPMVSEQDVGIKQYLHANGGKSPYPESLFKGLGDKVDAREQGRIRQAEYRFPRLVGKVYAWNAEGKLLGTTVLNHDLISPQIWGHIICGGPDDTQKKLMKVLYEKIEKPLLEPFSAYKKSVFVGEALDEYKDKAQGKTPKVDLSRVAFFTNTDKAPELVVFKPAPKEVSAKLNAIAISAVKKHIAEHNQNFKDRPDLAIKTVASVFKPCEAKSFDLEKSQESRQIYVYDCIAKRDLQDRAGFSVFHNVFELNAKGEPVPIRIRYQLEQPAGIVALKPKFATVMITNMLAQSSDQYTIPDVNLSLPKYYVSNQAVLIAYASFHHESPSVSWSLKAGAKAGDVYTITKETWPEPYLE